MRSKLALLMAIMLLASMATVFPAHTAPAEEIYILPVNNPVVTPGIGVQFNVSAWITDYANPNVFAYQVKLWCDDTMLNITRAWRPTWNASWIFYGLPTVGTAPALYDFDHDGSNEATLVGDSLMGVPPEVPPPEPALLAIIEFNITRAPLKKETLTCPLDINNGDTLVMDGTLATRHPIKTNGSYSWAWTPPPYNPDVAVRPESLVFDQYHNWTNFAFDVKVKIENLHIGWALHNASLRLTYNTPHEILELVTVAIHPSWAGPNNVDTGTPGIIDIFVQGYPSPSGDIEVATITFKIPYCKQGKNPPQSAVNTSDLELLDLVLYDTVGTIPVHETINGKVTLYPLLVIPLAWFEVQPSSVTLGPDLVIGDQYGKEFHVNVTIQGIHGTWKMIGWQLRLTYDTSLLEVMSITEGPLLKDPRWNRDGTYFIASLDDHLPWEDPLDPLAKHTPNIAMGCLLQPSPYDMDWHRYPGLWNEEIIVENASRVIEPNFLGVKFHEIAPPYMAPSTKYTTLEYSDKDHSGTYTVDDKIKLNETVNGWIEWYTIKEVTRLPDGSVQLKVAQDPVLVSGTLATIRFKAIKQSWTKDFTARLDIIPLFIEPTRTYLVDKDLKDIPVDELKIVNGTYTVKAIAAVGRRIDLWMAIPPNGGQGLYQPADLVLPQTQVTLTAKVTYNWWPVQYKKVTFEVRDNHGVLWAVLQGDTDDEGHAYATFRMPWPCTDAEALLGKWNITASVTLADVVVSDWMVFDYDYLVHIWKITPNKAEYVHCETAKIEVSYGTKAMRTLKVVLAVTVKDELGVPIGVVLVEVTIGGAAYCTYKNFTTTVSIHIEKWAYAGLATVYASFLSALPTKGGEAVAQEATKTFWILPV